MLTCIRNAQSAKHAQVFVPSSKVNKAIANVLKEEGYIGNFEIENDNNKPKIKIDLKYYQGHPVIEKIRRVSRPGLRIYRSYNDLPPINGGLGIMIVSTPKGILSDKKARQQCVGGEVICEVT